MRIDYLKLLKNKIAEEHERRNKTKMMLQAVLMHRVSKHPSKSPVAAKEEAK